MLGIKRLAKPLLCLPSKWPARLDAKIHSGCECYEDSCILHGHVYVELSSFVGAYRYVRNKDASLLAF